MCAGRPSFGLESINKSWKFPTCSDACPMGRCVAESGTFWVGSAPHQLKISPSAIALRSQSHARIRPLLAPMVPSSVPTDNPPCPHPVLPPIPSNSRHSFQHSPRVSHHSSRGLFSNYARSSQHFRGSTQPKTRVRFITTRLTVVFFFPFNNNAFAYLIPLLQCNPVQICSLS